MSERLDKIRLKLRESGEALASVYHGVGDRWETQVYTDGEVWSAREIFAHLADAQPAVFANARRIASGEGSSIPEGFDVDRYNQRVKKRMSETTPDAAFAALDSVRTDLLAWIDTLDDAQLDIEGRHATNEVMPLGKLLRIMALHELAHSTDIARVLGISLAGPRPTGKPAPDADATRHA